MQLIMFLRVMTAVNIRVIYFYGHQVHKDVLKKQISTKIRANPRK